MQANFAQRWVNLDQAIQLLWKLAKQEGTSPSELNLIEAYLRSLPQETTNRIRFDQLLGLLNNLQKAIREGDASFLGQKRGYKNDKIVDVLEFIESRDCYNLGEPLWAGEREDLWRIWHEKPTPLIVVLTGGQGCLTGDAEVLVRTSPSRNCARKYSLKDAYRRFNGLTIPGIRGGWQVWDRSKQISAACLDGSQIRYREIQAIYDSGVQRVYEIKTNTGRTLKGTEIHPFMVPEGNEFVQLKDLRVGDTVLCQDKDRKAGTGNGRNHNRRVEWSLKYHPHAWNHTVNGYHYRVIHYARLVVEANMNGINVEDLIHILKTDEETSARLTLLDPSYHVHHKDEKTRNDKRSNLQVIKKGEHERLHRFGDEKYIFLETVKPETILSIEDKGEQQTYDIAMASPHNYLANGFVVHNTCKSSTCAMSLAYMTYLLSRWHNPQAELRMLPIDEIFIIIQSFKLETAEDAIYTRILRGVDASPYFQKHFPRNKKLSSELKFPHNIVLKPITGTINAIQSKNVVGGAVTEINEMKVHKTSVELAHTDKQVLDVGQEVFHNFRNRVRGRFTAYINTGDFICRIHIDSARRYLADFTDRMTKEAETDTTICVIERSLWSARPFDYVGQPKFPVELATEYRPARILLKLEDAEQWSDEFKNEPNNLTDNDWLRDNLNVILVPEGHRKDMETDLEDGLRDFAGVPAAATGRFIPYPKEITAAHTRFEERTGGASLFLVESIVLKKDMPWHEIINYDYVNQLLLEGEFNWSVHLDASLGVKDAAGLGFDRIIDEKVVEKGYFYDSQSQQLRSVENVVMPIHCCDGVLELLAPPGDHLDLLALQDLVIEIKHHINVKWATADWLQSESTIQTWRNHGIISGSQSVDKKPGAYFIFRHAIRDGRMLVPWHSVLDRETRQLKRITNRGEIKIDHPANGSKNCVDAVCGAVATCNRFFRIRPADTPKPDSSTPPSMQPQRSTQRRYGSRLGWGRL